MVAASKRKEGSIKGVWIRYRNKLKGVPLEFVRLTALDEVESSKICQAALKAVERELQGARPQIEEMEGPSEGSDAEVMEFSGDEEMVENPGCWEAQVGRVHERRRSPALQALRNARKSVLRFPTEMQSAN